MSWVTTGLANPVIQVNGKTVSNAASGSTGVTFNLGANPMLILDGTRQLASATITANCSTDLAAMNGICVAPGSPLPTNTGAASDCFNRAQFHAPGTLATWDLTYQLTGAITGTSNVLGTTMPPIGVRDDTFETVYLPVREVIRTTLTSPAPSVLPPDNKVTYYALEGLDVLKRRETLQQSETPRTNIGFREILFTPALRDKRFTLAVGASTVVEGPFTAWSQTWNEWPTAPRPEPQPGTARTMVTYERQESIAVPAGTYTACRFKEETAGQVSTIWLAKGNGVIVKSIAATPTGEVTRELTGSPNLPGIQ